jgi:type IV pilus assembly protein PilZ
MKKKPDRRGKRKPPPGVERRNADRRRGERILVDLKVEFQTDEMYLYTFIADLSTMGMFILSGNPYPTGTRLRLRFELPGEATPLEAEGEVRWILQPKAGQKVTPGMGVAFTEVRPDLVERLSSLVKKVVYFEAEAGSKDGE